MSQPAILEGGMWLENCKMWKKKKNINFLKNNDAKWLHNNFWHNQLIAVPWSISLSLKHHQTSSSQLPGYHLIGKTSKLGFFESLQSCLARCLQVSNNCILTYFNYGQEIMDEYYHFKKHVLICLFRFCQANNIGWPCIYLIISSVLHITYFQLFLIQCPVVNWYKTLSMPILYINMKQFHNEVAVYMIKCSR